MSPKEFPALPAKRHRFVNIRLTDAEHAEIEAAAVAERRTISDWMRNAALDAVVKGAK